MKTRWQSSQGFVVGSLDKVTKSNFPPPVERAMGETTHLETFLEANDAILRQAPFVIAELDLDGRITYSNWIPEQFRNEVVIGSSVLDKAAPADRDRIEAALERVAKHGETVQIESQDAYDRWWQSALYPIRTADGVIASIALFSREISEERSLRAQIQDLQRVESLGLLAGGITHDFNNLLVAILGNADLAAMSMPAEAPAQTFLQEIISSAQRSAELCGQLLAYSRRSRPSTITVDLRDLIREIVGILRVAISPSTAIELDLGPEPLPVEVDVTQLRQVIMNLVTNASDALQGKPGTIVLRTCTEQYTRERLRAFSDDPILPEGVYQRLEVRDTGVGMDRETCARMFEPFFTSKSQGRGLGLAAVLGILRAHRGAIRVVSERGRGTTMCVLLPESRQKIIALEHCSGLARAWKGVGTILIVDDEEGVRRFAKNALESAEFQVLLACNGQHALEVFQAHRNDITAILLDVTMPKSNGIDTLKRIREEAPELPILMSSGYAEHRRTVTELAQDRATDFLSKPYRVQELQFALNDLLARNLG